MNGVITSTVDVFDAPAWFVRDFARAADALRPFVKVLDDGFRYVDPTAPEAFQDYYHNLCCYGFARGYL